MCLEAYCLLLLLDTVPILVTNHWPGVNDNSEILIFSTNKK